MHDTNELGCHMLCSLCRHYYHARTRLVLHARLEGALCEEDIELQARVGCFMCK